MFDSFQSCLIGYQSLQVERILRYDMFNSDKSVVDNTETSCSNCGKGLSLYEVNQSDNGVVCESCAGVVLNPIEKLQKRADSIIKFSYRDHIEEPNYQLDVPASINRMRLCFEKFSFARWIDFTANGFQFSLLFIVPYVFLVFTLLEPFIKISDSKYFAFVLIGGLVLLPTLFYILALRLKEYSIEDPKEVSSAIDNYFFHAGWRRWKVGDGVSFLYKKSVYIGNNKVEHLCFVMIHEGSLYYAVQHVTPFPFNLHNNAKIENEILSAASGASAEEFNVAPSMKVDQINSYLREFCRESYDGKFVVFLPSTGGEKVVNIQVSYNQGAWEFDWVLASPVNIADELRMLEWMKKRGVSIEKFSPNDCSYYRTQGGDIAELVPRIFRELYEYECDKNINTVTG